MTIALISTPRTTSAGRRQADYYREVLQQELAETHQRVHDLTQRLIALLAGEEAPITVKRTRRALQAAVANGRRVTEMLDALNRSYPVSPDAVAS